MSTAGMTHEQANDFLAIGPRLVEKIKAATAGMSPAVHVLEAADLADVKAAKQHVPAVHVIYGGPLSVVEDQGLRVMLAHTWHVVCVVKHVGSTRTGQHARAAMGVLSGRVLPQLVGTKVDGAIYPIALARQQRGAWFDTGTQYLPFSFNVTTVLHRTA